MTTTPTPVDNLPLVNDLRRRHLPDRARRRQIREAVGASIRDVAKACGVSHWAIYSWEKPGGTIEPQRTHRLIYRQVLDALDELGRELNGDDQTQK
jgi:DNA-binding XRE family transcriptional regulator